MEDDLKLQDFDQWVKIFKIILKHEGENLSKESKISVHPTEYALNRHSYLDDIDTYFLFILLF